MSWSPDPRNPIYLRRRGALLVTPGQEQLPLEYVAALLKNLSSLGYTCSAALILRLQSLSERALIAQLEQLLPCLKEMVGAQHSYEPFYPDFPRQVMEAEEVELYLNAILHYLGDHLGLRILPDYDKSPRPPLADTLDLKILRLGDEAEFWGMGCRLMAARTSISQEDREDLAWMLAHYEGPLAELLPVEIPYKENLAFITSQLMGRPKLDTLLCHYFKTATDVLRLAVALSEGDLSLAENTRFRSFKRPERRLLLSLLERCSDPIGEMLRYKRRWIRLGERLHPGEHQRRFPLAASAFEILRKNRPFKTFNACVEEAIRGDDLENTLSLLKQRPGELARRLDLLLRRSQDPDAIMSAFQTRVERISTPVLLQLMAHFKARGQEASHELRVFFPKGLVAKMVTIPNTLPPLEPESCLVLVEIIEVELKRRFALRPPLGRVFVDIDLLDYLIPFSQRSASKALRTLTRGSKLIMPPGETIRFFLWWREGVVDGVETGRVDIDLSAIIYDEAWRLLDQISYTQLRSEKYNAAHSGDITSAPDGACEFIDLEIASLLRNGGRYVLMSVLSFTEQPFLNLPECYAGWMMRQRPDSGEVFEPATVIDRVDLSADTRICIPVVLDMETRKSTVS